MRLITPRFNGKKSEQKNIVMSPSCTINKFHNIRKNIIAAASKSILHAEKNTNNDKTKDDLWCSANLDRMTIQCKPEGNDFAGYST